MPDPPDHDPLSADNEEPTSPYLSAELGALWAFLQSRHPQTDADPQPEDASASSYSQKQRITMSKSLERQQLEAELAERAWQDEAFRAELMANPRATIARAMEAYDAKFVGNVTVYVHEESPTMMHLVLPMPLRDEEENELDDEMLDLVAGGGSGEGEVDTCVEPNCGPQDCTVTRYS